MHCSGCLLQLGLRQNCAEYEETDGTAAEAKVDIQGTMMLEDAPKLENYVVRSKLGEGGFGSVYLAEQIKPMRRQVALKIIKLGMDTRQMIARFLPPYCG